MFGGDGAVPSAKLLFSSTHGNSPTARDRPNPTTGALTAAGGARALEGLLLYRGQNDKM